MFSPCQLTLDSDLLSHISKYPMWNQMDISLFIKALQNKLVLKVCRTPGPTACLKLLHTCKCVLKGGERRKKIHDLFIL